MIPSSYRLLSENVRDNCIKAVKGLPLGQWDVTIKRQGKSNAQRSYFHVIIDLISQHTGQPSEDIKWRLKDAMGMYVDVVSNDGTVKQRMLSTEELNKKDYSMLIEQALILAHAVEVPIPLPSHFGYEI